MDAFNAIINNRILMVSGSCWIVAQILKTIIYAIVNKTIRLERMVGDGGMPSCHSATVCGLATATALTEGVGSPAFAIAVILAIIVMHDAMGVRLETGKQAKIINDIVQEFRDRGMALKSMSAEERLKEFVGHTGIQVLVGGSIGIAVACFMCLVIYS